jgi:hypothetical protein
MEDNDLPYASVDDLAMPRYERLEMQVADWAPGEPSKLNVGPSYRSGN